MRAIEARSTGGGACAAIVPFLTHRILPEEAWTLVTGVRGDRYELFALLTF
jgi:hypothetical protein